MKDYLICPQCTSIDLDFEKEGLVCSRCRSQFTCLDGKYYFIKTEIRPQDIVISRSESQNYEDWSSWRKANFRFIRDEFVGLDPQSVLLDIGAGPSQFSVLKKRFQTVINIDFRPYEDVQIIADITKKLPIRDASMDIVMLSNVIEHTPEPEFLFKECKRVLKPGGRLILTVPFVIDLHQEPYDFLRYTPYMLRRLCEKSGLEVLVLKPLENIYQVFKDVLGYIGRVDISREGEVYRGGLSRSLRRRCFAALVKRYHMPLFLFLKWFSPEEITKTDVSGLPKGYGLVARN